MQVQQGRVAPPCCWEFGPTLGRSSGKPSHQVGQDMGLWDYLIEYSGLGRLDGTKLGSTILGLASTYLLDNNREKL